MALASPGPETPTRKSGDSHRRAQELRVPFSPALPQGRPGLARSMQRISRFWRMATVNDLAHHLRTTQLQEGLAPADVAATLAAISSPRPGPSGCVGA